MRPTTGVLLANVGTPDAPRSAEVRRYLREFLSDPRVVDIHPVLRFFLLNFVILPFRPRLSAAAYRKVWLPQGSPLAYHSEALRQALADNLGGNYAVRVGMSYGRPPIRAAIDELMAMELKSMIILPLFPQYASASHGTAAARSIQAVAPHWNVPAVKIGGAFYDAPEFIEAQAALIDDAYAEFQPDYVLFSYHGVPERHIDKSEAAASGGDTKTGTTSCDRKGPCPQIGEGNRMCYRAQCYQTTRSLAGALGLADDQHGVSFQSRLGRTPWIRPYTDEIVVELAKRGVKRLMVTSPSFVADCLETLEELGIRLKEQWLELGGEAFKLVPCLNAEPRWVQALAGWIRRDASVTP